MRFMFTCGGTAGHIYPAIAVADRLRELFPDAKFMFVGVRGGMETELVPREGYPIETLVVSGVRRGMSPQDILYNLRTVWRTERAMARAKRIIRNFAPDAVLGTGGYVCYPVIRAAHLLDIPTFVHESNALPGLTTKLLERFASRIMVGFDESREYYRSPDKIAVTGTPVRSGFVSMSHAEARREIGYGGKKPLVLSFWGSLGAARMNEYTAEVIARNEHEGAFYHIHATGGGEAGAARMRELLDNAGVGELKHTEIHPFIYNMPVMMAAADIVMCRSGASTIAELTATGTPTVQIPSKNVTNNHQEKNARVLEKRGGAVLITEAECSAGRIYEVLRDTVNDPERLAKMSRAMLEMGRPDAVENIVQTILPLLEK